MHATRYGKCGAIPLSRSRSSSTLALGIGLTTAIYSVVNAVLLRPLAYPHPDRMVWLTTRGKDPAHEVMNSIDFANWQSQATTLQHMVAYDYSDSTLVAGGEASRIAHRVGVGRILEVTGARSRCSARCREADPQALAITHRVFREQFHSDPGVIGRAVTD